MKLFESKLSARLKESEIHLPVSYHSDFACIDLSKVITDSLQQKLISDLSLQSTRPNIYFSTNSPFDIKYDSTKKELELIADKQNFGRVNAVLRNLFPEDKVFTLREV